MRARDGGERYPTLAARAHGLALRVFGSALGRLFAGLAALGAGLGGLRRFTARRRNVFGAFGRFGRRFAFIGRVGLLGGRFLGRSLLRVGLRAFLFGGGGLLGDLFGHRLGLGGRLGGCGLDFLSDNGLGFLLRRSGGFGSFGFLRCTDLDALLGLLARL